MLSAAELADLRQVDESAMFDTATIYRPPDPATASVNAIGEADYTYPDAWQTVAESVPCRVNLPQRRSVEHRGAGKEQATEEPTANFPAGTVIDETCRIRITASQFNPLIVGEDYDVTKAPLSSIPTSRKVEISKTTR